MFLFVLDHSRVILSLNRLYSTPSRCGICAFSRVNNATVTSNQNKYYPHQHNGKSKNNNNSKTASNQDRKLLRNIGIVAHINAGKTTTTERILYHAGSTSTVGDVDKGNTITDFLVQERDRGITITSAAVTYNWKKHRINLIDTPGHVDFTFEVERSLSVLDGVVTILDASAGVEAQTVTVWNQALGYNLPNVIFLNKTDKLQADYKMCLKDLTTELNIRANLIQLPVKRNQSNEFNSIIDIVKRNLITWPNAEMDNGSKFGIEFLEKNAKSTLLDTKFLYQMEEEREKLINILSDCDETFASHVLECDKIIDVSSEEIKKAICNTTKECKFSPVLLGSSYKYIGVQQLMDAIISYLPSPIEREKQIFNSFSVKDSEEKSSSLLSSNEPCAFIFKIMHDKRLGALNYIRIFSGQIERLQRLQNLETKKLEQIKKIYRAFADELCEINEPIFKDDIVVVTGLTESKTGDILVGQNFVRQSNELDNNSNMDEHILEEQSKFNAKNHYEPSKQIVEEQQKQPFEFLNKKILVPKISKMEPVYFCTIESPTLALQFKLEEALACLSREDPSFTYEIDSLGVGTIRGMGKLHLEVTRDRIQSEYGIDSILGPLQISYRETIDGYAVEELQVDRLINSVKNNLTIKLYVRSKPQAGAWSRKKLRLDLSGAENNLTKLRTDHRKAIETGLMSAMSHGPTLGYPMIDCDILLLDFKANYRCGLPVISSAASQCLTQALARCTPVLLEPMMLLEVVAPKECNSSIISDLSSTRRGLVISTQARPMNNSIVIKAQTPLANLSDYSEYLRILTSGRARFSMELYNYVAMSDADRQNIVRI